jgi:hypothetical protein
MTALPERFSKWQNSWGQFQAEGTIEPHYVPNGDFRGGMVRFRLKT